MLVAACGAVLAGALGVAAGRSLALDRLELATMGASRLYVSGPRIDDPPLAAKP